MRGQPYILLACGGREFPEEAREILEQRRPVRDVEDLRTRPREEVEQADLIVITRVALDEDPRLARNLRDLTDAPLLLIKEREEEIPPDLADFDDAALLRSTEEIGLRADLLLSFQGAWEKARDLDVGAEDVREALSRYSLDAGLVARQGLVPPGRVNLHQLVDVEAVNRQQMSICRLMGTAYGTFLNAGRPRGLRGPDDEEMPPTGALSPYCAYLSAQGGRCLRSEHGAARRALLSGNPVETTCAGQVLIYTVPVTLTFHGLTYPLYAASVAVGGVASPEKIDEVAEDYGVNTEILRQMAEESRFWVLNPDKVEEIKQTISTLAKTISHEVSHKYGTAFQLFRGLLTEREIRRSKALLAESHEQLEERNSQLKRKNEEIYEVTHAITHDLRKPLSAMKATLGMLVSRRLGELTEIQTEAVGTSHEAMTYMQQLVDDLLEAARLDTGRKMLEFRDMELEPLLEKIRKRFQFQCEEQGITLEFGDMPPALNCDESAVEKVLMNLIGNAMSYIGDDEKIISVTSRIEDDMAEITVADSGIGIPAESLAEVFEKFKRGANVSGIRGTGLGLAIVKGFIEAHGGEVKIQSAEGMGTRVSFSLPIAKVLAS